MVEIIAEIGQNHNGDMKMASAMIRDAKACGADVVKFQLYDAKKLFSKENNPWYDYNCKTEISREQLYYLKEECDKTGIEFMASAFDIERIQWLEDICVKRHKIASRSVSDESLVNAFVSTNKDLIISLGMWEGNAFPPVRTIAKIYYLYCIAQYPADLHSLKLASVDFTEYAGFSDHSIGICAAMVAISRGARIIEKHFTLDKNMYGPDHSGSMTPEELTSLHEFRLCAEECL